MSALTPVTGFLIPPMDALPAGLVGGISDPKKPVVDYIRPDYALMLHKWRLMDDVIEGQHAIKAKGAAYLPVPFTSANERDNLDRYIAYKDRAIFYNVTRRTLAGLVGEVFSTEPVIDIPPLLEPIMLDVDGGGVGLDQQARQTLSRVLALGRCGLYVDYPTTTTAGPNGEEQTVVSKQDELKGNLRPVIYGCHPADVINWRIELIGSRRLLTLVVIRESFVTSDDGFKESIGEQYRALRLKHDDLGKALYYQQLYRKNARGEFEQFGPDIIPKDFAGNSFEEIMFTFVGADNNDPLLTDPPLYDLAVINIGHYRNSADYEEGIFMLGNPTPYFTGLTKQWVDDVLKGAVMLGARAAVLLPQGATAGLLQVQANTMGSEALQHKEDQMRGLGAKLVEIKGGAAKTATQDNHENAEDSSILSVCATNVSAAYSACLRWAVKFVMPPSETTAPEYTLNTDFSMARMSPAERLQLMKEWQGGAICWEEYRFRLHRAGVAYMDDEKAKAAIEADAAKQAADELAQAAAVAATQKLVQPIDNQKALGGSQ